MRNLYSSLIIILVLASSFSNFVVFLEGWDLRNSCTAHAMDEDEDDLWGRRYYYDRKMTSEDKLMDQVRDTARIQLQKEAEKNTWNMYERLEKEAKLSYDLLREYLDVKHLREHIPNYELTVHQHVLLWYYFCLSCDSPYCNLRIQRDKETGEYMSILGADFYRKVYPEIYHWTLEKDKQYILLHEEVISCDELQLDVSSCETLGKAMAAIRDEKLCVAKEIAKKFELNLLYDIDIKQCLTDFVYSQTYMIHIDQTREMYLRLLNEDFQKRIVAGDESLLIELDRKYKLWGGGVLGIRHSLQCFRDLGGLDVMVKKKKKKKKKQKQKNKIEASTSTLLCQKKMEEMILDPCQKEREKQHANWIKKIKEVIEGYCKQRKESYVKANGFVDYLRLKIEIAKESGIVIKDGEVWREKGWEEFRVD